MHIYANTRKQKPSTIQRKRSSTAHSFSKAKQGDRSVVRNILQSTAIQPKLTVGASNDRYEQEADAVSDKVMRMPDADVAQRVEAGTIQPMQIQRMCSECEEEMAQRQPVEEEEPLQAKESPGQTPRVSSGIESGINSMKGGGQPLDAATRSFFEPRFGRDFSGVRVHQGGQAADISRSINARAFTLGNNVVFGAGQYQPQSSEGKRLLGHELTHVVQQGGSVGRNVVQSNENLDLAPDSRGLIQRDLFTPVPTPTPPAQPELTESEIREAIHYNRRRYNRANSLLIQDIFGTPVGEWTHDSIIAIALAQEKYGLTSDGKVGPATFRFATREQGLAGVGTTNSDCLTMFRVVHHPVRTNATPGPAGTTWIQGNHEVEAQFSDRCRCSRYEYRQFIEGVATGTRGAAVTNLAPTFRNIPGGQLPRVFAEDGMTQCTGNNYGHRNQVAQNATSPACGENRYMNTAGVTDQARGCRYRGVDFPGITVPGLIPGDAINLVIRFRGEIQRNGRTIQTKRWTTVNNTVITP